MKKHWQYLKYVFRHKWYVFWSCVEYGLFWRGLVHDLSKFTPEEWIQRGISQCWRCRRQPDAVKTEK
ncbi:MAG: DUF5662 family protein [Anaerolineae bacterium]|nr:DUF5662 family protein [Anaerolineae bacterium]